jgi:hypothetical protein
MNETGLLICLRDDYPVPKPPGSVPMKCSDCGALVTVSPSSWQIIHDHPKVKIVCQVCSPPSLTPNIKPYTPDQMEEIIDTLKGLDG